MVRLLAFFVAIGALAFGAGWLVDRPGAVTVVWQGWRIETSVAVAVGAFAVALVVAMLAWSVLRFVFRVPTLMSLAARARRREKGLAAVSRGLVAVGAGDRRAAERHARDAHRYMADQPLTLLLRAQTAQLSGDPDAARRIYSRMADQPETRALGLRGLHVDAKRAGDDEAAVQIARAARQAAALPWAGEALLDHATATRDWPAALAAIDADAKAGAIERARADRLRAVVKTAQAIERAPRDSAGARALAKEALGLAPDFVPAAALSARLAALAGDARRASRTVESAWRAEPHPDLADVYVHARAGDAAGDRLVRARALARIAPGHAESRLAVARAALEARAFDEAREAVAPLISGDGDAPARPTRRACLLMADLEQTQGGTPGAVREWLARAAIAPRDPAWIADGVIADRWSPVSPVTGKLDAFAWRAPDERITDAPALPLSAEPADARAKGEAHAIPPREAEPALIEHAAPAATEPPPAPAHPAPPADAEPPIRPLPPRSLPPVEARALPGAPDDPGPHEDAPPRKRGWFD